MRAGARPQLFRTARPLHRKRSEDIPMNVHAIRISLACACFLALMSPGHVVRADDQETTTTTTTTTTTQGTVTQIGPNTFVVKTIESPDGITFSQTRTTSYVDESGKLVPFETIQTGVPVTVYYDQTSGGRTATRVVVKKTTVKREHDDED
jgi:hypothetical protein